MNQLSTNEAAALLGVSAATVRNWWRAGHLAATTTRPLVFAREAILSLQEHIRTNRFSRLRKRANKSAASQLAAPEREDTRVAADIARIGETATDIDEEPSGVMFAATVRYLGARDEVALPDAEMENFDPAAAAWRREPIRDIMLDWHRRLAQPVRLPNRALFDPVMQWENCEDRLGLLYQGLSSVGRKSLAGAFFTPRSVIDASLADLEPHPASFLDPCCGTGRYLVRAATRFCLDPSRIHGFDSDPVAVDVARLNVLLAYPDLDFIPDIRCLDSLRDLATGEPDCDTNHLLGRIDAVATNPPWGGCKNQTRYKNLVALIKSGESFSLFLEKSLRLVRDGGRLSFILPEAVLKVKAHTDIRHLLLAETSIRKITMLGRVFAGVFTPIIRLDLEKRAAPAGWQVAIDRQGAVYHAPQSRFVINSGHAFDVAVTPRDGELLDRIYAVSHHTLRGHADWALGIVTGDNERCLLDSSAPDAEPVLRGRDIFKYAYRAPRCFIHFQPKSFQQVAPERYYRAPEKLIYRFVSERLVFAYDNRGILTLNSANVLIPRLPHMSIKAALGFLNSKVFQYIFSKRFRTRKILRGDLETLPFPSAPLVVLRQIEDLVDQCMAGDTRPAEDLERLVFSAFGLGETEIAALEESLADEAGKIVL